MQKLRLCPWCVCDENLSWSKRGKDYDTAMGGGQQKHICTQHLWPYRKPATHSPICKSEENILDFPEHLYGTHGLNLFGGTKAAAVNLSLDRFGRAFSAQ